MSLFGNFSFLKLFSDGVSTAIAGESDLFCAIRQRENSQVRYLLQRIECQDELTDEAGISAIHFASRFDNIEVIDLLLARGLAADARDAAGNTPLHYAAKYDNYSATKFLTEHGCSPAIRNNRGETAYNLSTSHTIRQYLLPLQLHPESAIQRSQQCDTAYAYDVRVLEPPIAIAGNISYSKKEEIDYQQPILSNNTSGFGDLIPRPSYSVSRMAAPALIPKASSVSLLAQPGQSSLTSTGTSLVTVRGDAGDQSAGELKGCSRSIGVKEDAATDFSLQLEAERFARRPPPPPLINTSPEVSSVSSPPYVESSSPSPSPSTAALLMAKRLTPRVSCLVKQESPVQATDHGYAQQHDDLGVMWERFNLASNASPRSVVQDRGSPMHCNKAPAGAIYEPKDRGWGPVSSTGYVSKTAVAGLEPTTGAEEREIGHSSNICTVRRASEEVVEEEGDRTCITLPKAVSDEECIASDTLEREYERAKDNIDFGPSGSSFTGEEDIATKRGTSGFTYCRNSDDEEGGIRAIALEVPISISPMPLLYAATIDHMLEKQEGGGRGGGKGDAANHRPSSSCGSDQQLGMYLTDDDEEPCSDSTGTTDERDTTEVTGCARNESVARMSGIASLHDCHNSMPDMRPTTTTTATTSVAISAWQGRHSQKFGAELPSPSPVNSERAESPPPPFPPTAAAAAEVEYSNSGSGASACFHSLAGYSKENKSEASYAIDMLEIGDDGFTQRAHSSMGAGTVVGPPTGTLSAQAYGTSTSAFPDAAAAARASGATTGFVEAARRADMCSRSSGGLDQFNFIHSLDPMRSSSEKHSQEEEEGEEKPFTIDIDNNNRGSFGAPL